MSADEKPVFWDCADGEELHHTDPDDAIECHLNNWFPRVPETVTLTGYTHDVVPIDAVDHLLGRAAHCARYSTRSKSPSAIPRSR